MNVLIKFAFRQILGWIAEKYQDATTTPSEADDHLWQAAYHGVRELGLHLGAIDDGGIDDPGPTPQGGGDGGP